MSVITFGAETCGRVQAHGALRGTEPETPLPHYCPLLVKSKQGLQRAQRVMLSP